MARQRLSNYELIRVISMVLIVFHHFGVHSRFNFSKEDHSFRKAYIHMTSSFGKVGVDLFMMLAGYFLAGRPAKVASVVRSWIQVLTYAWGIYFIFWFQRPMGYMDKMESFFPVIYFGYWFVTAYMVVVLMSPALGQMSAHMTHGQYVGLLSLQFMTLCVLNYRFSYAYSHVFYFSYLYLIGSYLKLFESAYSKIKTKTYFIILMTLLAFNFVTIEYFATNDYEWVQKHGGPFFLMIHNSGPLALFISVFIFLFVGRLEFWSPIVNLAGSVSFGIYLIHDNRFLRNLIWNHWIKGQDHYKSSTFEFYFFTFFAPVTVYIVCGGIEWCRQKLLGKYELIAANYIEKVILSIGKFLSYHLGLAEDPSTYYELDEQLPPNAPDTPISV